MLEQIPAGCVLHDQRQVCRRQEDLMQHHDLVETLHVLGFVARGIRISNMLEQSTW